MKVSPFGYVILHFCDLSPVFYQKITPRMIDNARQHQVNNDQRIQVLSGILSGVMHILSLCMLKFNQLYRLLSSTFAIGRFHMHNDGHEVYMTDVSW